MQPYFDPTRKTTAKKNGRQPKKNKMKTNSKKIKNEDDLKKIKKLRRPQKKIKKMAVT